jgi:aspartate racemase
MKLIGLIGGMSWESSIEYYRILNETVREKLGGLHSARCLLYSLDFEEIEQLQQQGRWDTAAVVLTEAARVLEHGGADCVVICTNTMHLVAEDVQQSIQIPLLHIADATAERVLADGYKRVGLLGTRYTMEKEFYRDRLTDKFDIEVLIPSEDERSYIDGVIFNELVLGELLDSSRSKFLETITGLVERGAQGIILGCTEIGLLVSQDDVAVPVYDTAVIHAEAAVEFALSNPD